MKREQIQDPFKQKHRSSQWTHLTSGTVSIRWGTVKSGGLVKTRNQLNIHSTIKMLGWKPESSPSSPARGSGRSGGLSLAVLLHMGCQLQLGKSLNTVSPSSSQFLYVKGASKWKQASGLVPYVGLWSPTWSAEQVFGKSCLRTAKICGPAAPTGIQLGKNPVTTSVFFLTHADLCLNNPNLITEIDYNECAYCCCIFYPTLLCKIRI